MKLRNCLTVLTILIACLFLGTPEGAIPTLSAQDNSDYHRASAQIPSNRTAQNNIKRALSYRQEGNIIEFIKELHETRLQLGRWVVPSAGEVGLYRGVSGRCFELLFSLDREGRRKYRTLFDGQATAVYSQLGPNPREKSLLNIYNEFPLSTPAANALHRLVLRHLRNGAFDRAAELNRKLLQIEYRKKNKENALAIMFFLLSRQAKPEAIQAQIDKQKKSVLESTVTWKGNRTTLLQLAKQMKKNAKKLRKESTGESTGSGGLRWRTPGGNATHSQIQGPDIDLDKMGRVWRQQIPEGASDLHARRRTHNGLYEYWAYYPTVSEGAVFHHNGHTAWAWSLLPRKDRNDGNPGPLWSFSPELYNPREIMAESRMLHTGTYWNGIYFCNLVTDMGESERQLFNLQVKYPIPRRTLYALDAGTGRVLWKKGGGLGKGDFMNGASFSTGPIIRDGVLYASVCKTDTSVDTPDQYLMAINPRNGNVLWKTFITKNTLGANLFGNPIREVVTTVPVVGKEFVYYSTNVGVVAAVDRETGQLEWLYRYHRYPFPERRGLRPIRQALHWENNLPVKVGDRLLLTPADSPHLLVFEASTGKLLWKQNRENLRDQVGGSPRWMVPAGSNRYLIASEHGLKFYSIERQGAQISDLYRPTSQIMGRPAVTRDHLYLSTVLGLEKLNITKSDSVVKTKKTQFRKWKNKEKPGNVFLTGSLMMVAGARSLQVYYTPSKLQSHLDNLLKANPEKVDLRLQRGLIREKTGEARKAIEDFRFVLQHAGAGAKAERYRKRAREALIDQYLKIARDECKAKNVGKAEEYFKKATNYVTEPRIRQKIHDRAARCYLKLNKPGKALQEFRAVLLNEINAGKAGGDIWEETRQKIKELVDAYGEEIYGPQEKQAQKELDELGKQSTSSDYLRLFYRFPNSDAAITGLFRYTASLMEKKKYDSATETLYKIIRYSADTGKLIQAYLEMVTVYEETDRLLLAAQVLKKLKSRYPEQTITQNGNKTTVKSYTRSKLDSEMYRKAVGNRKEQNFSTPLKKSGKIALTTGDTPILVKEGKLMGDLNIFSVVRTRKSILILDTEKKQIVWKHKYRAPIKNVIRHSSRLIVVTATGIDCRNLVSGGRIWNKSIDGYPSASAIRLDTLFVSVTIRDPGQPRSQKVTAIEIGPGRLRWWTGVSLRKVDQMLIEEEHLLLTDRSRDQLVVLAADDGTKIPNLDFPISRTKHVAGFTKAFMLPDNVLVLIGDPSRNNSRLLEGVMAMDLSTSKILWEFPKRMLFVRDSVHKSGTGIIGLIQAQDPKKGFRFVYIESSMKEGGRIRALGELLDLGQTSNPVLMENSFIFADYAGGGNTINLFNIDPGAGNGQTLWKTPIQYTSGGREALLLADRNQTVISAGIKPVNANGQSAWLADLGVFSSSDGKEKQSFNIPGSSGHRPDFMKQGKKLLLLFDRVLHIYK